MNICIVGGGLMGMSLARKMTLDGHAVTVLEQNLQPGGLSTWKNYGDFVWDRFYHVMLPSDRNLLQFVRDLGLSDELRWQRTNTGFYVDNTLHSISSNLEFLRFPPLSLLSKARLAYTMLYCARIEVWQKLEAVTVEDWLLRVSGRENYEKLWKPLLLAKLGEHYRRVSAVFIWSYVKRMFSARDRSASAEHLGHVTGGYRQIFERLISAIEAAGGRVRTGVTVQAIRGDNDGKLLVAQDSGNEVYDQVVCTSPVSVLRKIAPDLVRVSRDGADVEYLGVVCVVIVSSAPLVPYYVVNIADDSIPFTGVIGMSTVIDTASTGGHYLTYLPKYVLSTDDYLQRDDTDVKSEFLAGIRRMLPEFDMQQVRSVHVHRAAKVQPLQVLGYSNLVPRVETLHPGFYVLNTSQFMNSTLNNNEVIGAVNRFHERNWHPADSRAA